MPDLWMDVDAALAEVPINIMPLLDDTDFKTREEAVAYNAAGLELIWHFTTTAGATTATVVTPTTGGNYDWAHQDGGMYTIEIPASGGASINNDTEGFGWFTGVATGVLPWRGPVIGFRAAGLNNALIDSAYSATRGLAGTALPDAAADAAGGLPISDAGALAMDALVSELAKVPKSDSNVTWNATALGSIQSECDDALVANNLDHLAKTATAGADMTTEVADNTILSRIIANGDTSAFDPSTDGLQPWHDVLASETDVAAAILASVVEAQGSYTLQQALSIILAVLAGVTADNGATLKSPNGSATRVAATIDANKNRTAMTLTPSA